jgi:hypothetical protein
LISETTKQLTPAGEIGISLIDSDNTCLFVGFVFTKFQARLVACIQSPRDFLFVCSHFLTSWRAKAEETTPTLTHEKVDFITPTVRSLMEEIQTASAPIFNVDVKSQEKEINDKNNTESNNNTSKRNKTNDRKKREKRETEIFVPTEKITALYVLYPDLSLFDTNTTSISKIQSLIAHFLKKIEIFQKFAKLPFGDEALVKLKTRFVFI